MEMADLVDKVKRKYVGKWIGLKDGKVVVVSDTHEGVYEELRIRKIDGVYVFYSPREEERRYGFLFKVSA